MRAWKPLQMPSIRPSRFFSRSWTWILQLLCPEEGGDEPAEPSGSSPPEKPPGRKTIWAWAMLLGHQVHGLGNVPCGEVLDDHDLRHGPAWAMALAASYSQLVPGEDGDEHPGAGGALMRGFFQLSLS